MPIRTRMLPLALVGLLAGCAGGAGSGAPSSPPPLAIGTGAAGLVAAQTVGGPGGFRLAVALPAGPARAPVRRPTGEVERAQVLGLARVLGLTGEPVEYAYGWALRSSTGSLSVRTDGTGSWTYSSPGTPTCEEDLDRPAGSDDSATCAAGPALTTTRAPGRDRALALAAPVLRAVGLDPAAATVRTWSPTSAQVQVDPTVAGLPTAGLGTSVQVVLDRVLSASGNLRLATEPGDDYPLVSARTAWTSLSERPVPEIGLLCPSRIPPAPDRSTDPQGPAPDSAAGDSTAPEGPCAQDPVDVTSVRLGLTARTAGSGAEAQILLVPTWIFAAGTGVVADVVAVDPAYLTEPEPADTGTGGAEVPGSVGPGSVS